MDFTHPHYFKQMRQIENRQLPQKRATFVAALALANAIALTALVLVTFGCSEHVAFHADPTPAPSPVLIPGMPGERGEAGLPGTPGIDGQDGQDGTFAEFIQFCPGTPVYPTVFPEYGIKVGSQIYAVYSANGGFLALLPSGIYLSNAIGSRCTFTVTIDGEII